MPPTMRYTMIETLMKCQAMLKEHGIYLSKITVDVDKYGASAKEKKIDNSVKLYKLSLGETDA